MKLFLQPFSSLPLNHSRRVVVSYERKYVYKVLVNCTLKLAQKKVWLSELTIAVDLGRKATKQTNKTSTQSNCILIPLEMSIIF